MKRIIGIVGAMCALGAVSAQAVPYQYGNFSLRPGETRQIGLLIGREVKVCNNYQSSGAMTIVVSGHEPHFLFPGVCADDVGDVILATNHGNGATTGTIVVAARAPPGRNVWPSPSLTVKRFMRASYFFSVIEMNGIPSDGFCF